MSRKAIIEFRKVANSQTLDVDKYFFDNIIPIYEDSVHTPQERAKILEKDILWLLNDMVQADKAIDRSNPDRQQRIPFFNYRNLLRSLILSTADKGIYLSESFVKAYENVDMGAYSFGEFVRNAYKPAWWEVQPQQKKIKEPKTFRDRIAGNVDADELIAKLHTLMDNKSGKEAVIYLRVCMDEKKIKRYGTSYKIVINEFQIGCNSQYYYKCLNTVESIYSPKELEAAKKELGI